MLTKSVKMALKKIKERCEDGTGCAACPFNSRCYGCFFLKDGFGKLPEDWDFDLLRGEDG